MIAGNFGNEGLAMRAEDKEGEGVSEEDRGTLFDEYVTAQRTHNKEGTSETRDALLAVWWKCRKAGVPIAVLTATAVFLMWWG